MMLWQQAAEMHLLGGSTTVIGALARIQEHHLLFRSDETSTTTNSLWLLVLSTFLAAKVCLGSLSNFCDHEVLCNPLSVSDTC